MTKEELIKALTDNNFYLLKTAKCLGIGRTKLKNYINLYGIEIPERRGRSKKWKNWDSKVTNVYYKMISRCYAKDNKDYAYYGGRGISVFDEWKASRDAFEDYCKTLPNAFKDGYSIDRIDNNSNYEPGNIRFITHEDQCNNRRNNRVYYFNGENKTIAQWAREYGHTWEFVRDRLKLGWTIEQALIVPKYKRRDYNDKN